MWYVPERDISIIESSVGMTKSELEKFLGYKEGRSGMTVKELQDEAKDKGKWVDNRFVIVNFDILEEFYKIPATRSKENIQNAFNESPMLQYIMNKKSLIIIDEAHRLSNNTSIRYKIIKDLIKRGQPDSIYLATGTPITNNPQNLYCVLQFLDDPITNDWQYYMDRYCGAMKIPAKGEKEHWTNMYLLRKKKTSWYDLTQEEKDDLKQYIKDNARHITITKDGTNLEELKLRISHIYLRRTKEDLSNGLPNKTIHEVFYDFNMLQEMEYDKLWDEYEAAQLEVDPTKEINKELLEGAIYRKYCSNQMVPNTIKMTDDFISKGEKVIIATCYDEELNMLKDYYGDKCVVYNGKMNTKQKDAAQKSFMEDPNVMVFIGNIQAASVGLTLIVSHTLIFNNIDFVPGNNRQMEDRVYRIGQTKDVDIYYQMYKGTQYEKMWNLVMKKELIINQVIKKENEK
jgi:SWI/SNF-related matrix-associated actin-dependent regulator 1 of chromatin subfamily A